ncbi:MAG: replication-relaxation family protein [Intestinibacter bartlettii]
MQERDLKILSFLTMCRICTRKQVQELLFPDVHENIPLRRLKKLTDEGYINRKMFNVEGTKNMYVYYLDKQPKKKLITHDLYITDFLVKLIKNEYEILDFKKSPQIGNIIPDAYLKIRKNKRIKRILLEVQISPNDCLSKYKEIKEIIIENTDWPVMPILYVINNQGLNKRMKDIKVIYDSIKIEKVGDIID